MARNGDLSDVERNLIINLCEYLESEGIVSTYETKNLLSYSDGLKAQKAVTAIFNQVSSRLQADGFDSVLTDHKRDFWPRLAIEHPDWRRIFGKGKNQKIAAWFMVPGVWDAKRHDFYFEIDLWREEHGNDWQLARSKLPKWLEALKLLDFEWNVAQTWSRERSNTPASEIQLEPKRIYAYRSGKGAEIFLNQDKPQNEDELVDLLVNHAKRYAKIVSSLKS